jgi:hypothetical protein
MDLLVGLRGERWVRGLLTGAKRAVIRRSRFSPDFGVCVYGHSLRSFNFAGAKLAYDESPKPWPLRGLSKSVTVIQP